MKTTIETLQRIAALKWARIRPGRPLSAGERLQLYYQKARMAHYLALLPKPRVP